MKGFTLSLFCIISGFVFALTVLPLVQRTDTGPPGKVETVMHAFSDPESIQPIEAISFTCYETALAKSQESQVNAEMSTIQGEIELNQSGNLIKPALGIQRSLYLYRWYEYPDEPNRLVDKPPITLRT